MDKSPAGHHLAALFFAVILTPFLTVLVSLLTFGMAVFWWPLIAVVGFLGIYAVTLQKLGDKSADF